MKLTQISNYEMLKIFQKRGLVLPKYDRILFAYKNNETSFDLSVEINGEFVTIYLRKFLWKKGDPQNDKKYNNLWFGDYTKDLTQVKLEKVKMEEIKIKPRAFINTEIKICLYNKCSNITDYHTTQVKEEKEKSLENYDLFCIEHKQAEQKYNEYQPTEEEIKDWKRHYKDLRVPK